MSSTGYRVPASAQSAEQEIKRSRFIAIAARTDTPEAAKAFIEGVRAEHPQARHVCSAFVAGAPTDTQCLGFSDDGEPNGTAGKPILAVLQGSGVGEIAIAVVRYSGGIKLGTGGLVRAYGGTAQMAMQQLAWLEVEPQQQITLTFGYDLTARVEQLIAAAEGKVVTASYDAEVRFEATVPTRETDALVKQLTDAAGGQISCVVKR
ncbi:YigZ family protein [Corallincola platygyrae]|uniref:YigZ family protein n=1 Tax=Corallincola platygyrae TaxID=1193278 RepID=A0ABW4XMJ5_9GAMM